VRFDEALHEFTTLPGVKEDVTDIILNLKDIVLSVHTDEPVTLRFTVEGARYTAQYRLRGETQWRTAGTGKLPASGQGKDEISLQCYDGPPNAQHWMRCTDFRILR